MTDRVDNRSLGELIAELTQELGRLIRNEVELARIDLGNRLGQVGRNAGLVAAGGSLALGGFLVLLAAAVLGLAALGLDPWIAALVVGIGALGVGYVILSAGMSRMRQTTIVPVRSIESIKEDAKWVTGQKA
jgi:hypothetical protein